MIWFLIVLSLIMAFALGAACGRLYEMRIYGEMIYEEALEEELQDMIEDQEWRDERG